MLRDLIGIDRTEFNRLRGSSFYHGRSLTDRYARLFDWAALNDVLRISSQYAHHIQLVKEDQRLDRALYTHKKETVTSLVPAAIRRGLAEGYSLLLNDIQSYHAGIRNFADALIGELGENIGVNAYVSWRISQCFLTHWDDHDVLIVQTQGQKRWAVFEPSRPYPLSSDVQNNQDKSNLRPVFEGTIEPGDVLYIPRGWWHHAAACGTGSIHLTVGFSGRCLVDVFNYLALRAAMKDDFRKDLVRPEDSEYAQVTADSTERFLRFVEDELKKGLLDAFWRHHYANLKRRTIYSLPTALDIDEFKDTNWLLQLSSLAPVVAISKQDGEICMEIGQKRWCFSDLLEPVLRRLATGRVCPAEELAALAANDLSVDEIEAVLFDLVNDGVLNVLGEACAVDKAKASHQADGFS